MAKKPRLAPEDMPTEREVEGIRQLLMLTAQIQRTLKKRIQRCMHVLWKCSKGSGKHDAF